ncbi:MAG: HDIG domain-containing protein [SAR324 cluster bacterium]|nr:HDIG domain-containing protein [SAR324 cluster bacterium]
MNRYLSRERLLRAGLMVGLALAITVMIAPNLNLLTARYEEGDIIPENIIISDNVTLVDERSTELRRQEALANFPPIYDHDPGLKNKTLAAVGKAFAQMREGLAARRKNQAEALERIRRNSLLQIEAISAQNDARLRLQTLNRESRLLIAEIGRLTDLDSPSAKQEFRLEKLRFDLLAVEAQRVTGRQENAQLDGKLAQLAEDRAKLEAEEQKIRQEEAQSLISLQGDYERMLGVTVEEPVFRTLHEADFNKDLQQKAISLLRAVYDQKIVASREGFAVGLDAIQIQTLDSDKPERFEKLDLVAEVRAVRDRIAQLGQELNFPGEATAYREATINLAQRLIRPNLTENKGESERQKQELLKNLSPVYFNMKQGDVVARAGDVAAAQQVEIIHALNAYNLKNPKYPQIIGTFLIVLLALGMIYRLLLQRMRNGENSFSRLLLMSLLLVVTLLLAQLILFVVPALTTVYDSIPSSTFNFLIPAALTSLLASILLGFEIAVFLGFVVSLCLAILLGNSLSFFLFAVMGSFIASIPLQHYENRFSLWLQGLRISGINLLVLGVLTLLEQNPIDTKLAWELGAAALNGLGVAFLTATLLPVIERAFDITTNLRLLELSNMNNPALKELSVRAPGTYHHSIVVGNLSDSAAGGIQANPLLVRVASYYHDLGKMLCPLYFIENQGKTNYHDDLPARTSARIIVNHIKDGLEIAKRHRLGKAITDIIAQHHGNSLVRFFYHKAQEEQGDLGEPVDESEFRYPGPKPQTKEAGLVMVADVTEAATRSLSDPSPEAIRQTVQKLATRIYTEGQLDESGMTFNDLNYIEKTFTKMLISIHHHRIAYPELDLAAQRDGEVEPEQPPAHRHILGGRRATS